MLRTLLMLGLAASCVTVASAQEPAGSAARPLITEYIPPDRAVYVIEMKVLEGKGLIGYDQEVEEQVGIQKHIRFRPGSNSETAAKPVTAANTETAANPDAAVAAIRASPSPAARAVDAASNVESGSPASPRDVLQASKADGSGLWDDNEVSKVPGVTVVAAPKVALVANIPATVQIGSEQIFSYLEAIGNGKFAAKHTAPQELGLSFTLEAQPVEGNERLVAMSRLEIQVSSLDGREPVEGVEDLDVGKPIVAKRSLKTTAKMRLGETRIIAIPSGPKTQAVLLIRVNREVPQREPQPKK